MYGSTAKHADDEAPGMEIRAVDLGFASTAASVSSSSSSSLPQRQWHLELHDVSFAADAGEVLFCVGAAGSWGRSLLELLADRKTSGRRYGRVLYDGADVAGKMRRAAALVSDDGSLESLSVLRTLEVVTYAARLSGAADPAGRAKAVLDKLRLGAVADTIVGNATIKSLSGGERKRLTIAVGLVAPRVRGLLLDEPTSGLDSATALEVMSHVRGAVAKGLGKTTVAYVQGASGALLARAADRLLVFVEGRLAFRGSAASAKTFFAAAPHGCAMAPGENVAELLVDVANRSRLGRDGAAHARAWEHRRPRERVPVDAFKAAAFSEYEADPPFALQFHASVARALVVFARSTSLWGAGLLKAGWIAMIYSATFKNQNMNSTGAANLESLFYFSLMFAILGNLDAISQFFETAALYRRERADGRSSPLVYFCASNAATVPWVMVLSLGFATTNFWSAGAGQAPGAGWVYLFYAALAVLVNVGGSAWSQLLCRNQIFNQTSM